MPPVCHLSLHCPDHNHELHEIWSVNSQEREKGREKGRGGKI